MAWVALVTKHSVWLVSETSVADTEVMFRLEAGLDFQYFIVFIFSGGVWVVCECKHVSDMYLPHADQRDQVCPSFHLWTSVCTQM